MSRPSLLLTQSTTVYYHRYRPLYFGCGLLFLSIAGYSGMRMNNLVLTVFALLYATSMVMLAQVSRIIVSPTSITYHNLGYTIRSPWVNVDRLISVPTFLGDIRYLVLQQPAVQGWTGLAWLVRVPDRGRTIPLSNGWSRLDQLEQQIQHYAPHIIDA